MENATPATRLQPIVSLPVIASCDGCGACCMEQCSPPFIGPNDPELETLPLDVLDSYRNGMKQREVDGWPDAVPCFWFDQKTLKCSHYEQRPEICRDALERGDEGCLLWREQFGVEAG